MDPAEPPLFVAEDVDENDTIVIDDLNAPDVDDVIQLDSDDEDGFFDDSDIEEIADDDIQIMEADDNAASVVMIPPDDVNVEDSDDEMSEARIQRESSVEEADADEETDGEELEVDLPIPPCAIRTKRQKARATREMRWLERVARRKEAAKERAEREEVEAGNAVTDIEKKIVQGERSLTERQNHDRLEQMEILMMEHQLQQRKSMYFKNVQETRDREVALEKKKDGLEEAKRRVVEKKNERIRATEEVDEDPYFQSLAYPRACDICGSENPRKRAVMVKCGHITCTLCAERQADEKGPEFACPTCRTVGSYMKMFEQSRAPRVRQAENATRKRNIGVRTKSTKISRK